MTHLKARLREEAAGMALNSSAWSTPDECRFPPNRRLDVPSGFLPGAKSVLVMGMHIRMPSVLPDGAIPFDDVPGSQYYTTVT